MVHLIKSDLLVQAPFVSSTSPLLFNLLDTGFTCAWWFLWWLWLMTLVSKPPTTDNVANIVSGINGPYDFVVLIYGAHRNQALAHTLAENCKVFWRSGSTNSDVHVVKIDNDDDVAILMAMHGNISKATIWAKNTAYKRKIFLVFEENSSDRSTFVNLQLFGIIHVRYATDPALTDKIPVHNHLRFV